MSRKLFTWQEIEKHNTEISPWLAIDGKVYDVTDFQHKHPGGDLILMGAGNKVGTELFISHHPLSTAKLLDKYYIGEVKDYTNNFIFKSQFYDTLKNRVDEYLAKNSLKRRDSIYMYIKALFSFLTWIFFYCITMYGFNSYLLTGFFAILCGWSVANVGMAIMHDGNHGGFSNSSLMNRIAGGAFDVLGGSSYCWKMIHSVGHHCYTNVEELDPDIHTNEPHFRRIKKTQEPHFWYKFQYIYLLPMYSLLIFELFFRDILAMAKGGWGGLKFQPVPKIEWILFYVTKIWYLGYSFIIPMYLGVPLKKIILVYVIVSCVASEILVLMFQVNHVTHDAKFYNANEKGMVKEDWAIVQVEGSTNFAAGSLFWNFFSGGLNHQIEHHLFPTISHVHYPEMSKIVRETCKEFNVKYHSYSSFWTAVGGHIKLLKDLGSMGIKYNPKFE